jgi:hypothetical protein
MKVVWNWLVKASKEIGKILKASALPWLIYMCISISAICCCVNAPEATIIGITFGIVGVVLIDIYARNYRKLNSLSKETLVIVKNLDENDNVTKVFYLSSDEIDKMIDVEILEYKEDIKKYGN